VDPINHFCINSILPCGSHQSLLHQFNSHVDFINHFCINSIAIWIAAITFADHIDCHMVCIKHFWIASIATWIALIAVSIVWIASIATWIASRSPRLPLGSPRLPLDHINNFENLILKQTAHHRGGGGLSVACSLESFAYFFSTVMESSA
jgi:hypothetical protein